MKPELKAKWIAALRSGTYAQTDGCLKRKLGSTCEYCCIGVLAEVLELPSKLGDGDIAYEFFDVPNVDSTFRAVGMLPYEYLRSLGLRADQVGKLTSMNDDERASFSEIADWIEANVKTKGREGV